MWFLNPDKVPLPWRSYCLDSKPFPHDYADSLPPVTVLVGVMSIDRYSQRRNMIRQTYARKSSPRDGRHIHVVFAIGQPRPSLRHAIQLEQETFGDLIILNMKENMNSGKTYEFFNWASNYALIPKPSTLPSNLVAFPSAYNNYYYTQNYDLDDVEYTHPDFVVKADDDSFIILGELERHLRILPKRLIYWGYLIKNKFMGGEAYALSFDLIKWISQSSVVKKHKHGTEDKTTAKWLNHHPQHQDINWVNENCWIYNHPKSHTVYSHGFLFPSYVTQIRQEEMLGLVDDNEKKRRGQGHREQSDAYSTVFKWNHSYKEPRNNMPIVDKVAALIEGSDDSLSEEERKQGVVGTHRQSLSERMEGRHVSIYINFTYLSLADRNIQWGGTVIVHYVKRHEWFYETALAFLTDWKLIPNSNPKSLNTKNYWTKTLALNNKDDDFDRQRGWRLIDGTNVKSVDIYKFKPSVEPFPVFY